MKTKHQDLMTGKSDENVAKIVKKPSSVRLTSLIRESINSGLSGHAQATSQEQTMVVGRTGR